MTTPADGLLWSMAITPEQNERANMSSKSQPSKSQSIVPCECGHSDAFWHGEIVGGLREYCCDNCWDIRCAIRYLQSEHIQQNKHRLGVLGQQDLDLALSVLIGIAIKTGGKCSV